MTLWEELLDGRVQPQAFVDAGLRALPHEPVEQNVQLMLGYLDRAFWTFLPAAARGPLAPGLERLLRAGIARAESSSLKSAVFLGVSVGGDDRRRRQLSRAGVAPAGDGFPG